MLSQGVPVPSISPPPGLAGLGGVVRLGASRGL